MAIAFLGQISGGIKYAAAGTVIVWLAFYYLFPAQPLSVSDTLVVLVVLLVLGKAVRALYVRFRRPPVEHND